MDTIYEIYVAGDVDEANTQQLQHMLCMDVLERFMQRELSVWHVRKLANQNAEELCITLCKFITEIRKPNNEEYPPDTILYMCIGIQYFLYEHNRNENIFFDVPFVKFTDILHQILASFCGFNSECFFTVTRINESVLWESKFLGQHSPTAILNTLMYFNTKFFGLITIQMHMEFTQKDIIPSSRIVSGNQCLVLKVYPKRGELLSKYIFHEQVEEHSNPLRCPVNCYMLYLQKCPAKTCTRDDVFYLRPEKTYAPESPVWYSKSGLSLNDLDKMLRRILLVKEINAALLLH